MWVRAEAPADFTWTCSGDALTWNVSAVCLKMTFTWLLSHWRIHGKAAVSLWEEPEDPADTNTDPSRLALLTRRVFKCQSRRQSLFLFAIQHKAVCLLNDWRRMHLRAVLKRTDDLPPIPRYPVSAPLYYRDAADEGTPPWFWPFWFWLTCSMALVGVSSVCVKTEQCLIGSFKQEQKFEIYSKHFKEHIFLHNSLAVSDKILRSTTFLVLSFSLRKKLWLFERNLVL